MVTGAAAGVVLGSRCGGADGRVPGAPGGRGPRRSLGRQGLQRSPAVPRLKGVPHGEQDLAHHAPAADGADHPGAAGRSAG